MPTDCAQHDVLKLRRFQTDRVTLYVNPTFSQDVDPNLLIRLPDVLDELPGRSTRQASRTTAWEWQPRGKDGQAYIVRLYAHGGALGSVLGTAFMGQRRMLREFRVHAHARRCGVPTSAPVALRVEHLLGPVVRAHLVSRKIPHTCDLLRFLRERGNFPAAERDELARRLGKALADMHDAGIYHGDLNLQNLLVRGAAGQREVFIIDFDKAKIADGIGLGGRMSNLLRLDRSLLKWPASREWVGPLDRLRVLRYYLQRYPQWRDRWAELGRRYARSHARHALTRR